ncbi:NYN domain-containing protein [Comamonadaceae bacterium OH2545_COT-014]|nr:NYN domain-containing protein [Comamonadaceae bacterium OH2545_COT-014]
MTQPAKSTAARNLAVFIDADNLNDPTALDHVLTALHKLADRIIYRRAYGRAESLKGIEAVLWRHGVRPVANLIVDKTTTDSALVIDAVEAVCRNDIDIVAICSGDADFVPLAMWLREHHCRVLCYSLSNKIFANPESFYDEVVLIDVLGDSQPVPLTSVSEPIWPLKGSAAEQPARVLQPSKSPTVAKPKAEPSVKSLLKALPALSSGTPQHLSVVAKKLRAEGLLSKNGSSTALFKRYSAQFELLPAKQPNTVRYRG